MDFGAKGDSVTDDTDAVEATIAAARLWGQGAIAYFPYGVYQVNRTLNVTGSNYYIGGTGFYTCLRWAGINGGTMMTVQNPQNVVIEHLSLEGVNPSVRRIVQTGSGASSIKYDGVYTWCLQPAWGHPEEIGLQLLNLPAGSVVLMDHFDGHIQSNNSSAATILGNVSYEGVVRVLGSSSPRTGFFGFLTRVSALDDWPLVVNDNQDIVIGNWYDEQSDHYAWLSGSGVGSGHVTIKGVKIGTDKPSAVNIVGYSGRVTVAMGHFVYDPARVFPVSGSQPLDLVLMGNMFWDFAPIIQRGSGTRRIILENLVHTGEATVVVPNMAPTGGLLSAVAALDDFRRLGPGGPAAQLRGVGGRKYRRRAYSIQAGGSQRDKPERRAASRPTGFRRRRRRWRTIRAITRATDSGGAARSQPLPNTAAQRARWPS